MLEERICTQRPRLTAREREIVISAISARATGKPEVAAVEILVGIAVIDGHHPPILLWPNDMTYRGRPRVFWTALSLGWR